MTGAPPVGLRAAIWGGIYGVVPWPEKTDLTSAAAAVVAQAPTIGVTLRLLADACGARARALSDRHETQSAYDRSSLDEEAWAYWSQALAYLTLAEVLDSRQRAVAFRMIDRGPWAGTLEDLVVAAKAVAGLEAETLEKRAPSQVEVDRANGEALLDIGRGIHVDPRLE